MSPTEQHNILARTTLVWALSYGAIRTYWQLAGAPLHVSPIGSDLVVFTGWWGVGLCGAAALLAAAMLRPGRRAALPVLIGAAAVSLALAAAAVMLVLDLVGNVFPGMGLNRYPLGAASRIACASGGVLLMLAARSFWLQSGIALPAVDRLKKLLTPLDRTPRWAYLAAYVSMSGCLTRVAAQAVVGFDESRLSSIAFEACFVLAGTLLPLALVHSWGMVWPRWVVGLAGRRVPRRLVLWPGAGVSVMIIGYFGVMLGQMVVERLHGRNPFPPDARMDLPETFFWVAVPAYVVWGAALAVATLSYQRRSRGIAPVPRARGIAGRPSSVASPSPHVPHCARRAAQLVPFLVLPSALWRLALLAGLPVAEVSIHEWWEVVYIASLVALSEGAALLTLGLVKPWGEIAPRWIPWIGGRPVRPLAAFVPAMTGAAFLTVLWAWVFIGMATDEFQDHVGATWKQVLLTACYAPLLAWGPVLAAVAVAYWRRRSPGRTALSPSVEGMRSLSGGMAGAPQRTRLEP